MQEIYEMQVQSLGQEDPLVEQTATHSCVGYSPKDHKEWDTTEGLSSPFFTVFKKQSNGAFLF